MRIDYFKILLIIILFLSDINSTFGQAQIKFDTTTIDFGQIFQCREFRREIHFTNIGKEPLFIYKVYGSDGGALIKYNREPIMPSDSGVITFIYDTEIIGKFIRTFSIYSNSQESGNDVTLIKVKGEVVWKKTTIIIDNKEKDIGQLNYGDVDTVQFIIKNTGNENLHIHFNRLDYSESDLLRCQFQLMDSMSEGLLNFSSTGLYRPEDIILVTVLIKNVYGNTGQFERNLFIGYNSNDTLFLKIKGQFVGLVDKKIIYEGSNVMFYENNRLVKKQDISENGKLRREYFFDGSYCVHILQYHWYKNNVIAEYFYNNGKLIDSKTYNVDNY